MPSVPPHVNLPRVTIDCLHPDVNNHELVLTPRDARVGAKTDLLKTIGNKIETPNPRVGKKTKQKKTKRGEWMEKRKKLNG